ncbi:hypothetical protein [Prochlorococcus sp. MIT 1306]|uniref:hypothetical protein n=1 Tax=Prochlorococcus sp. MIT 1306 TaxID=1799667 RepID=UPI0007BBC68D|nr:hypothetical protein [Prochlorococcus sp. MIT 1306]KZR62819.1 hypothetical protein PMIT1306_01301 [Prochlorococcus sp. MIT 1306]
MKFSFYSLPVFIGGLFPAEVDLVVADNIIAEFRITEQHLTAIYAQSHHLLKVS